MATKVYIYDGCCECVKKKKKAKFIIFSLIKEGITFLRGNYIMANLKEGQFVDFTLKAVDSQGNPASVDGAFTLTNSNPGAVDMFVNPDGMSGRLTWLSAGTSTVAAEADADLSTEVRLINGSVEIVAEVPEAQSIVFELGPIQNG